VWKDERIVDSNLRIFHLLNVVVVVVVVLVVVVFGIAVVVADLYEYTLRKQIVFHSFFGVISRRLNFMYRRFGTLCSIFIGYMDTTYEDGTDSVPQRRHIKFRHRGITQKSRLQHSQHG
jgi:hypothetical protein